MKLLGVYSGGLPDAYKEIFADEGIEFSEKVIEDTFVNMGRVHTPSKFEVFVPQEDYDRAVSAINFYEKGMEQKVAFDRQEADRTMSRFFLGALIAFGFLVYIGYVRGWW